MYPMKKKPTQFPNRIREWRERRNLVLEDLSAKTRLGVTKLYRLEVGERLLKVDDAEKIASALAIPAKMLMYNKADNTIALETIMVMQIAHAGVWRDRADLDGAEWKPLTIPKAKSAGDFERYGVEVSDDSMDMMYPPGSVVVCEPLAGRQPRTNQRVVVRRTRGDGKVEITVRQLEIREDGRMLLWPRSTRPEYQQPGQIGVVGDVTSVIDALVVGSFRPE